MKRSVPNTDVHSSNGKLDVTIVEPRSYPRNERRQLSPQTVQGSQGQTDQMTNRKIEVRKHENSFAKGLSCFNTSHCPLSDFYASAMAGFSSGVDIVGCTGACMVPDAPSLTAAAGDKCWPE